MHKIRRRCLINWALLLCINTLPQVSYLSPSEGLYSNALLNTLVRFTVLSLLLFAVIYALAYYSYMYKKYRKDVLYGIWFGIPWGIGFGLLCASIAPYAGIMIPGIAFALLFSTFFGTYQSAPEWIPPATAVVMGVIVATVASTTLIAAPFFAEGHVLAGAIISLIAGTICLIVNAFLVALPAFIKAVRHEKSAT